MALVLGPGQRRRKRAGSSFLQDRIDDPVVRVRGVPCLTPRRALFDEVRTAGSLRDAVVAADMTIAAELTTVRRMERYTAGRDTWRGVPLVREALSLAAEGVKSPPESRLRLVWLLDAGLPPPLVNRPVFDLRGRLLGYPDLMDVEAGLVVEYDGADHRRVARQTSDIRREEGLRGAGLEVVRVTSVDLRDLPTLRQRLLHARSRARFVPAAQRQWTLALPPSFYVEPTLDFLLDRWGIP